MGIVCAMVVGISTDIIPVYFGIDNPWRLGSTATCFQVVFMLPAILKYNFIAFPVGEMAFALFTNANEAIVAIDNKGFILRTNKKANELFRLNTDEINNSKITDQLTDYSFENSPPNIETKLLQYPDVSVNVSQTDLAFGGYYQGKVLIIRDISERIKTALELKGSEEKYRTLIESSSDIIYYLDLSGNFTYTNPAFERIYGYKTDEIINSASFNYVRKDFKDEIKEEFLKIFENRKKSSDSGTIITVPTIGKDGTEFWMELNVKLIMAEDWVVGYAVVSRDITLRYKAEEKLLESEERYRKLVNNLPDAIIVHDGKTILFANEAAGKMAQAKSPQELHGKKIEQFIHPEYNAILQQHLKKLFDGDTTKPIEIQLLNIDGNPVIVEVQGVLINFHNKPAIQTVFRDITERKRASEALQNSEVRFQSLIETSPDGVAINDFEKIFFINKAGAKIIGQKPESLINKPFLQFIHPREIEKIKGLIGKLKKGEKVSRFDIAVVRKDGSERIIEAKGSQLTHGGKPAILTFLRDITDRIDAEDKVKASRQRLIEAQKMARIGSFQFNLTMDTVIWSETLYHIYGLDREKYTPTNKKFLSKVVHTDDRQYVKELVENAIKNRETSLDYFHKIVQPDGTEKIIHALGQIIYDDNREPIVINGSAQDVTELYNTRLKLEESEKNYRDLVELSPDAVVIFYRKKILYVNKEFVKMIGAKDHNEILNHDIYELVHPDSKKSAKGDLKKLYNQEPIGMVNLKINKLDGSVAQIEIKGMITSFNNQQAVMGSIRDVTEKIVAEQKLRASELSLSKAQEIAQLGSWEENYQTGEVYWSSELKHIFGVNKIQMIKPGQFWKFVHPDDLDWMKQNWLQAENKMVPYRGIFRIKLKDGTIKHLSEQAEFITDSKGRLYKVVGTVHDVTQVREYQDQLRNLSAHIQNLQEEERGRIAREIHDELGQNLTSINMDIDYLKSRGKEGADQDILNRLKLLSKSVNHTIKTTRRISQELRPSILDDLGLKTAIEWQVAQFWKRSRLEYKLNIQENDEGINNEQSIAIFRITQESLTNIARHADASEVELKLHFQNSSILLEIKDNGKGFNTNKTDAENKSFGIFGMKERAAMLGGVLKISSQLRKGTSINLELPLKPN